MKNIIMVGVIAAGVAAIVTIAGFSNARGLQVHSVCTDVEVLFARGSGQMLQEGESKRFFEQIEQYIDSDVVTINPYELGTESYDNAKYQAITIGEWWKNGNALGASLSAGYANDYGKSVDSGVSELYNYLTQRHLKCPSARIVLGGYSQGAQVIGQTLSKLSTSLQSNIDFVSLFGDPKLHLPEGEGFYPDACRGKGLSPWRRVIGNCDVDNGALSARKPYLSGAMTNKVGLWCNAEDFVCGSSKSPQSTVGHGQYKDTGGAIDQAAIEIASTLKRTLPAAKREGIDSTVRTPGIGTTGMQVAFMVNTSSITDERLDEVKAFTKAAITRIIDNQGSVALGEYRYTSGAMYINLAGNDTAGLIAQIDGFTALKDIPEYDQPWRESTLDAMAFALDSTPWRYGATKALVVLTDDPLYVHPLALNTVERVAKRTLEIDPVNIYPVVPAYAKDSFEGIASATSGETISSDDMSLALEAAVEKISQRPTALLNNAEYAAQLDEEITFDASRSYAIDASIVKYEWDFDGDGVFELTTTTPVANYTYSDLFDGVMQVRITASNNTFTNASALVKVGTKPEPVVLAAPTQLTATAHSTENDISTISLQWASNDLPRSWAVSMNGVVLGMVNGTGRSVDITGVPRLSDVEFQVEAFSGSEVGLSANITIEKIPIASTPEPEPVVKKPISNWRNFVYQLLRRLVPHLPHFR